MRTRAVALLLIFCSVALVSAQKTRYGQGLQKAKPGVDYPIKIHISGIHLGNDCTPQTEYSACIFADAKMDGKKIELMGAQIWYPGHAILLAVGDYQARLLKAPKPVGPNPIGAKYELLMPDRTVWDTTVTGISE